MPTAFLIVSVIGLLFTINAFRPLRVEVVALPAFFAGWLTSELPVHHLVSETALLRRRLTNYWGYNSLGYFAPHAAYSASGSQGEQVLVNQDLHAQNVLRAQREPWLVIDPKPLGGEREFGIAALVRGRELGHGRRAVTRREVVPDGLLSPADALRASGLAPKEFITSVRTGRVRPIDLPGGVRAFRKEDVERLRTTA